MTDFSMGEPDGELRGQESVALPTARHYDHHSAGTINRSSEKVFVKQEPTQAY